MSLEDFNAIVKGFDPVEPDDDEIVDVTKFSMSELIAEKERLERYLFDRVEALAPKSQEARDAHSLRNAIQVEIAKRTSQ